MLQVVHLPIPLAIVHTVSMLQVFDNLSVVAAGGQQAFTLPDPRPFWQQLFNSQAPYQDHTWRVLDLSEVRHLYKDAQKRETLFRQHRKAQRQLDAAAQAAAEREEAAKRSRGFGFGRSSSSSGADGAAQANAAAARKNVRPSSLDEFLIVSEVLKPLGETPRDLLEDSYAIIARDGRCAQYTGSPIGAGPLPNSQGTVDLCLHLAV
jgi:hypothetical protein